MLNIKEIIKDKLQYLSDNNVNTSLYEVKLLMADVLSVNVSDLYFHDKEITKNQLQKFDKYVEMRKNFWPVDKIIGKKSFYKLDFDISNDVLSPRYDTEILIEEALKIFAPTDQIKMLEFGTGSGCIIVSLLDELKKATAIGVDISAKAIEYTKKNATKNNVFDRLELLNVSWFDENIQNKISQKFDLIISNPPYIPSDDISNLDDEVKKYDPLIALDGGKDGLKDYRRICEIANDILKEDGFLIFEVGIEQANLVIEIAKKQNFNLVKIAKDYANIERCVILKK